jgi:hypothetical protein
MKVILAMFFLVFCSVSLNVSGQNTAGNRTAKCGEVVVRDQSHPVRKAIDAQYAKLADAIRKKDVDAVVALIAPDFQAVTPTGEIWNRERSLSYQRNGLAQVKETTHISNTILRLTICGEDEATNG